jgi:RNA polymerase-binding transcription factor DksA
MADTTRADRPGTGGADGRDEGARADGDGESPVGIDRARFTALLLVDRESTRRLIDELGHGVAAIAEAWRDSYGDDEHDPEGVTLAFERSQAEALAAQSAERLAQVDAALARLERGSYGLCEVCGRPIAEARLEARPFAERCIHCA